MKPFALLLLVAACAPSGRTEGNEPCTTGQQQCYGNALQTCQNGVFTTEMNCPNACDDTLGCVLCVPGTGTCSGNVSNACNADGMGYTDVTCDPVEGETCGSAGVCEGACAPETLGQSYIGCEYYATVTGNIVGDEFDFAVALANTTGIPATVTIDGGALGSALVANVAANTLLVQKLPWQQQLKLCNDSPTPEAPCSTPIASVDVPAGAYHIRSTQPITVYQFNSLEYTVGDGDYSYTNDASLLEPTNVWRTNFYAAAWAGVSGYYPSELAITAAQSGTNVTITSTAATDASSSVPAIAAGVATTKTLGPGEVLELTSDAGDFTGTNVTSDQPVQVISGHVCADVPTGIAACDHLEEAMFAVDTLSSTYVVNAPQVTSLPNGKVEVIRIIATAPNTTITYNPPQSGALTALANAGDYLEIDNNDQSFEITANQKILVAQYMEGQEAGGDTGDPAMALAVPVEQFRQSYVFQAPTSYDYNYVDVTAPTGADVTLDGSAALTFTPIGSTGYGLARAQLTSGPANDGNHSMTGSMQFGITVYGYGQYTSYWYPGGLNLQTIVVQ